MNRFVEKLVIAIASEKVFSDVHFRTYYQGETLKRKDADFASIQTSSDDEDLLASFLETAVNELAGKMVKRVIALDWKIEEGGMITFELYPYRRIPVEDAEKVKKLLERSMTDYMANRCLYEWLLVVNPELSSAAFSRNNRLEGEVLKHIGMVSGMVRRRATDLAGI